MCSPATRRRHFIRNLKYLWKYVLQVAVHHAECVPRAVANALLASPARPPRIPLYCLRERRMMDARSAESSVVCLHEGGGKMNEQELRATIASRVRAGILPSERPARTYAGTGEGATCACCGLSITTNDVQYELDFPNSPEGSRRTVIAHRDCHRLWQRLTEGPAARKRASRNTYAANTRL